MAGSFKYLLFIASLPIICGLESCSKIFESRNDCPTTILADFSQVGNHIENLMIWFEDAAGNTHSELINKSDFGHQKEFTVRRGVVKCYVWGNVRSATVCVAETKMVPKTVLIKKDDLMCDSLYFFSNERYVMKDTAVFNVSPHKQFATIFLTVLQADMYDEVVAVLNSVSKGFYYDGEIAHGVSTSIKKVEDQECRLRLLRQEGLSGISLDIDYTVGNEAHTMNFDLGKYLEEYKYDMKSLNMEDIYLTVDLINLTASITIGSWKAVIDVGIEF